MSKPLTILSQWISNDLATNYMLLYAQENIVIELIDESLNDSKDAFCSVLVSSDFVSTLASVLLIVIQFLFDEFQDKALSTLLTGRTADIISMP
ncbi:unnamed protein product, partial [Rotaria sp. Silwood2]